LEAKADLVIEILDSHIRVNDTGFIDVVIRSTSSDRVSLAGYEFTIANVGLPVGSLEFSDPQIFTEQVDSSYLFSAFQPTGNFTAIPTDPLTLSGGDYVNDPATESSTVTTSNQLLIRLDVQHVLPINTDPASAIGSMFLISLTSGNSIFFDDANNPINFTSIAGTATITAVPEPSSFLAVLMAGAGWRLLRHRKRAMEVL
jgi:hypothetical protein